MILEIVLSVLGIVITLYVLPWLKAKRDELQTRSASLKQDIRSTLFNNLAVTTLDFVRNTMEKEYPRIARRIKEEPEVFVDTVKEELYGLGSKVYNELIVSYKDQGIDILEEFGHSRIAELIRRAVDVDSPFQKRETAASFMKSGVASKILEHGLEFEWEDLESTEDDDEEDDD